MDFFLAAPAELDHSRLVLASDFFDLVDLCEADLLVLPLSLSFFLSRLWRSLALSIMIASAALGWFAPGLGLFTPELGLFVPVLGLSVSSKAVTMRECLQQSTLFDSSRTASLSPIYGQCLLFPTA